MSALIGRARRERFSMALLFGNNLTNLMFNKMTVQEIYNANYNFSKPPLKPTLTAVPGDKQVFLYWDNIAEQSRDRFMGFENGDPKLGYKKTFEGYNIYRSQEAEFNDVKIITDAQGNPKYWKPIAQFDLRDSVFGPDPVGINGARFWRGAETGLAHSYIDKDVKNGVTYYYALVSYTKGDPKFGTLGLQPTECTKIIAVDYAGNVQSVDQNCAVVIPNAPAAGYTPPEILGDLKNVANPDTGKAGAGTGSISVTVLNPAIIKDGASYKVLFHSRNSDTVAINRTKYYDIIRTIGMQSDTLVKNADTAFIGQNRFGPPFEGLSIVVLNDTISTIDSLSNWRVSHGNIIMNAVRDITPKVSIPWPCDYEIRFYDSNADTAYAPKIAVPFKIYNMQTGLKVKFALKDLDNSHSFSLNDTIQILEFLGSTPHIAWNVSYLAPPSGAAPIFPSAGDKFFIKTSKQFREGDYFTFSTKPVKLNAGLAKASLENIGVVPNPYLGAAAWEKRNLNYSGRGQRMIEFIHLPSTCTIRVFTIAGTLVKTLQKNTGLLDGSLTWDMVTEDGLDIAFGVYIYHVVAPGIGEHIGKFAVIK